MPDYRIYKNQFDDIIEKFMILYKTKESKASLIFDLLQFTQSNLTLREFIKKLRVELYKTRPVLESTEHEKTLIFAFLCELSNKRAAASVKFLQPTTLENAYRWGIKEVKTDSNENFRHISIPTPDLVEEIRLLRKKC